MKAPIPYSKFLHCMDKIKAIEESNPRFKRVYYEYNSISEQLWEADLENHTALTDDFWWALETQKCCLEQEIVEWLGREHTAHQQ